MHILLIHQAYTSLDEPGGTRHHELARFLAAQGNSVTVIASPISYLTGKELGSQKEEIEIYKDDTGKPVGQLRILRTYVYPALHRSFVHRTINFFSFMASSFLAGLGVKQVDLVWGTSPPIFQAVTAWLLARLKGIPILFEVRDLWPAFAVQVGVLRHPVLIRASEWLERFLYRRADVMVINSPGFLQHVQARGARRVQVLPNGSDTQMFQPGSGGAEIRRQHGLEAKFVALYAGAHGISNDLEIVLQAACECRDHQDLVFALVGDGKEKVRLMETAQQLGLQNILFLPPVPKRGMPALLDAADVCIGILKAVPLYATVYPNKIFDYMAAEKPVILAMEGVIREVVEKAEAGIPVPVGDSHALAEAVLRLKSEPDLARQMGKHGRRYVIEHFDRPQLADRLLRVMENLVSQNKA